MSEAELLQLYRERFQTDGHSVRIDEHTYQQVPYDGLKQRETGRKIAQLELQLAEAKKEPVA